jgi:hypothetical protein
MHRQISFNRHRLSHLADCCLFAIPRTLVRHAFLPEPGLVRIFLRYAYTMTPAPLELHATPRLGTGARDNAWATGFRTAQRIPPQLTNRSVPRLTSKEGHRPISPRTDLALGHLLTEMVIGDGLSTQFSEHVLIGDVQSSWRRAAGLSW